MQKVDNVLYSKEAWDSDFSKVTPEEKERLEKIEYSMDKGELYSEDEVWK